jgi:hypothetical protein
LIWATHNLERAADRVTHICERVVFAVTGEVVDLDEKVTGIQERNSSYDSTERTQRKDARVQGRKDSSKIKTRFRCIEILCVFAPLRLCVEIPFLQ